MTTNTLTGGWMGTEETSTLRLPFHRTAVVALMLVICALPSMASTPCTTVTSTADDGSSGTLRYAIAQANAASCGTITFSLSYPATITLAQGTLEISNTSQAITISGPGAAKLAISGNNAFTVFQIDAAATVSISSVTVENGYSSVFGGGVANAGTVTLSNSIFSGNYAANGGGGGIVNSGTAMVVNSTFSDNSSLYGGAILNYGTATVTNSTFSGNSGAYGGGIANTRSATGQVTISNSTFSGNSASSSGGGIFADGTTITVKNTLLANEALGGNCGKGLGTFSSDGYNLSDDTSCGTFFTAIGDLNDTPAGLDPGGLKNNGGPTPTIAILPTSAAFNVIVLSPTNYCTDVAGNPVTTDQRGISRPQVSACDIGAFEYSSDNDSAFAQLSGGNSFTGNQTVNGTMAATSFVGNGSGLTGVTASSLNCTGCVGNTDLAINYAGSSSQGGPASNALLFGGLAPNSYAQLSEANTFTATQNVQVPVGLTALTSLGYYGASAALGTNVSGIGPTGVYGQGGSTGGTGVVGSSYIGVWGKGTSPGYGVIGTGDTAVEADGNTTGVRATGTTGVLTGGSKYGLYASNSGSAGIAGVFNSVTQNGQILSGQYGGTEVFRIANNGNVNISGNLATIGSVAIGSGTTITKHLSMTFSLSVPSLKPSTCTSSTVTFSGASDGDTTALGIPNALMTGGLIVYSAWVSAANTVTIRACDINPNGPATTAASGTVRVDIWKH